MVTSLTRAAPGLPGLDLAGELVAGDSPSGIDVLQALLNHIEHVGPVDDATTCTSTSAARWWR